jgi:hypothetical protein
MQLAENEVHCACTQHGEHRSWFGDFIRQLDISLRLYFVVFIVGFRQLTLKGESWKDQLGHDRKQGKGAILQPQDALNGDLMQRNIR